MCKLTIKCDKCKRIKNSIQWKLQRNIKTIGKLEACKNETYNLLLGQNEGLEWALKKLNEYCECEVIKNEQL